MTDRYHSLTVVLEADIRDDDAAAILAAIRCIRGVLGVSGEVASPESIMAEARAKSVLGQQLLAVIYPDRT